MTVKLTQSAIDRFKRTARSLAGPKKRQFQASIALEFCQGSARLAESMFGWGRRAIVVGIRELDTGNTYQRRPSRGRPKTEDKVAGLEQAIRSFVDPRSQVDPKFQSPFIYTRVTAKAVLGALEQSGFAVEDLPSQRTIRRILNRLGYKLRRVRKSKPVKKIKETDAIFGNVKLAHQQAEEDEHCLRISIDSKAKVKIGDFSRRGRSRGRENKKALDHDMNPKAKLVPFGVLEIESAQLFLVFGASRETSDFIADCLESWWDERKAIYPHVRKLMIDLDNGPGIASCRTQFMKRLVEFADRHGLQIELVYYPPYHSKYNAIERCWGVLEAHWNGTLLNTIDTALGWAKTMTWKGVSPIVRFVNKTYCTGVKLGKKAYAPIARRLERHETLSAWSVTIQPQIANSS